VNDIDEIMEVELNHNKNDGMDDTMTICEHFMAQLDAKGNSLFASMEKTKVHGSFRILFHEQKYNAADNSFLDISTKLHDLGQWGDSNSHYRYITTEEVTIVGSKIILQKPASFCNNHFAQIGRATIPIEIEMEILHAPPRVKKQAVVHMSCSQAMTVR
jgi:hypothetical protein